MSNSLYEEAINAAEQIKEAAENKVKQQLIESMSPQIKQLVEKVLADETDGGKIEVEESEVNEETTEECGPSYESDKTEEAQLEESQVDEIDLDENEAIRQEIVHATETTEIDEAFTDPDLANESDKEMSNESINIFKKLITKNAQKNALKKKLRHIREGITSLKKVMLLSENNHISRKNAKKIVETYKNLCQELKNIKTNSIIKSDTKLLKEYLEISKELNNMSRRQSKKYLNESFDDLLEMHLFEDEEDEVEDSDAEGSDDKGSDAEGSDAEGSDDLESLLDDEAESKKLSLGDAASLRDVAGRIEDLLSEEDMDEEDMGEGELDEGDMFELDEMYLSHDDSANEQDHKEGLACADNPMEGEKHNEMKESSRNEGELFLEIDENMLKREISKMRKIRESDGSEFGGGSLEDEVFVDGVELNKLDEMKNKAALRRAAKKNRMLESKLSQYKKAVRQMKGQLSEMNLFNAKLLYANKLMQNRDLSVKQQRKIVESLDNAKTLNEAKLLFESLSGSLTNSNANRKSGSKLTEGSNRRLIGSSSRSTSSAQSLNESVALDRWATLAGIKK